MEIQSLNQTLTLKSLTPCFKMAGMAGGGRNYHPSLERQVFNMRNNTKKEEAVCHFADSF